MSRLNVPSPAARKRGEALEAFLAATGLLVARADLETYLELRGVRRYRVIEWEGIGVIEVLLPPERLGVLEDAAPRRPLGVTWIERRLPWWRRRRSWAVYDSSTFTVVR